MTVLVSHCVSRTYTFATAWLVVTIGLLLFGSACDNRHVDRPSPASAAPLVAPTPPPNGPVQPPDADLMAQVHAPVESKPTDLPEVLGPAQVVRRVNELRRAGHADRMAQLVVPVARPAVIELVRAVDQLVLANRALQEQIKSYGVASAARLDRPGVGNIIDVFSHDVRVVSQSRQANGATVTIQVGGRLPLSEVHLISTDDGGWQIQPDPPIPGLALEIRNLAKAQNRVARLVQDQHPPIEQIIKELLFWEQPILKRIRQLLAKNESTAP